MAKPSIIHEPLKQFRILSAILFLVFTMLLSAPNVLAIGSTNATTTSTSVWSHTYGSTSHDEYNTAGVILATKDGGYIVGGMDAKFAPANYREPVLRLFNTVWLLKLDAQGHEKWRTTFQITKETYLTGLKQTKDNGYAVTGWYVTGESCCEAFAGKLDSNGKVSWLRNIGHGYSLSIDLTKDGGYIIAGNTLCNDCPPSAWLNRLNSKGESVWKRTYAISTNNGSWVTSVQATSDGGFIATGAVGIVFYSPPASPANLWVFKTDKNGLIKWQKSYETTDLALNPVAIQEKNPAQKQSGYIVLGARTNSQHDLSAWLLSLDKNGNVQWQENIGNQVPTALIQPKKGGYVITTAYANAIKVSSQGSVLWHRQYAKAATAKSFSSITEARDSGLVIAGYLETSGHTDAWIIKTNSAGNCCKQLTTSLSTPVSILKTTVTTAHAVASPSHPTSTKLSSYNVSHTLLTVRVQC